MLLVLKNMFLYALQFLSSAWLFNAYIHLWIAISEGIFVNNTTFTQSDKTWSFPTTFT